MNLCQDSSGRPIMHAVVFSSTLLNYVTRPYLFVSNIDARDYARAYAREKYNHRFVTVVVATDKLYIMKFSAKEGDEVVVTARISTYPVYETITEAPLAGWNS